MTMTTHLNRPWQDLDIAEQISKKLMNYDVDKWQSSTWAV